MTYPACHHHHHHHRLLVVQLLLAGCVDAEHLVWHQPKWSLSMLEHRLPASRTATWAAVAELSPTKLEMTCPLGAVAVTTCNSIAGNEPHMYTRT